jgi:hypothetical protein
LKWFIKKAAETAQQVSFSATFDQIRPFSGNQYFPAIKYLLGSVLSFWAEN